MKRTFLAFFICLLASCSSIEPSMLEIEAGDRETVTMFSACDYLYDGSDKQIIAVLEFINRTTFTDSQVDSGRSRTNSAGVVVGNENVAVGVGASNTNFEVISRKIAPQIGEYAQSAVESKLVSVGGVDVVTRTRIEDVLKEQGFQMAIADPNTVVEFGRLMGAQYIVTGSVDNIEVSYTPRSEVNTTSSDALVSLLFGAINILSNLSEGWNIKAEMTTNLIDVSTGKIVDTKKGTGYANVGTSPHFTMDMVVAGSKSALKSVVDETANMFVDAFVVRGYVTELRGNKQVALVNIGKDAGLRKGDKLKAYEVYSRVDVRTGYEECQMTALPFTLTVLEDVGDSSAWLSIDTTDEKQLKKIKIGTIVQRYSIR